MKSFALVFSAIIFFAAFLQATGEFPDISPPSVIDSAPALDSMLAEMPDPIASPDEYAEWKISYSRMLRPDFEPSLRPMAPMDHRVQNGYVAADVDETSGEFDQGGDPGGGGGYMRLTYSWPGSPGTEWVMYYVDGNSAKTAATLPNASSNWMAGNVAYHVWNNWNGVYIRQEITPVSLGGTPGENEQIKFKAVMKSADGGCHNCGCIVYYDTMLDWNDSAPISTAFGYTGIAEIFFAPTIPPIWRAYESGFPPSAGDLVALGILLGFEATPPDVFWYGSWPASTGNGWPDSDWISDTGSGFGDSATMVKWYPRYICPGDSVVFITYYGIGDITGSPGLNISHMPPTFDATCSSVIPNPFPVEAYFTNIGTATANNVRATLSLPAGLSLASGANPQNLGSIAGYGGTGMANWTVNVGPSLMGTTVCYDISVTWTGGGPVTQNYCIDIPSPPDISISATADDYNLCAGECTNLHAVLDTVGEGMGGLVWSYSWSPTIGLSSPTSPNPTACPTSTTTYTVTATAADCIEIDDVTINVHPNPVISVGNADICEGESTTLTATVTPPGSYTYSWSPGGGTGSSITVSPSSTTTYACFVTSAYGCSNIGSGTVNVHPTPIVTVRDTFICSGESVTLSANVTPAGSWSYSWSPGGATSASISVSPSSTTTYTCNVSSAYGCDGSDNSTVTVQPDPAVTISDVDICEGETGMLTASVSPAGSYTYLWSPGGATSTSISVAPSATTTYTCEVLSSYGCPGIGSGTINVHPNPVVTVRDTFVCSGESVTLSANVVPAGSWTYSWSPGGATTASINVSPSSTTTYTCNVSSAYGCDGSDNATVTVQPDPAVTISDVDICEGETGILTASVSPAGSYTYLWSPGGATSTSISVAPSATTTYTCEVLSSYGCPGIGSGTINVHPNPVVTIADATICLGDAITLTAFVEPDIPGATYFWEPGGGTGNALTVSPSDTTTYTCTVTTPASCIGVGTATVNIEFPPSGVDLIELADGSSDMEPGVVEFDWTDADGDPPITYDFLLDGVVVASGLTISEWDTIFDCNESHSWNVIAWGACGADTSEVWDFGIAECTPPIVEIIEPLERTFSACEDQRIIMFIYDDSGIDISSIRFSVDGIDYIVGDGYLTYVDDTLIFTPIVPWTDGVSISCCLDSVCDIYGTAYDSLPVCWTWLTDFSPPLFWGESPTIGSIVPEASPVVEFNIEDLLSGLNEDAVTITINDSIVIDIYDPSVDWSPSRLSLSLGVLGLIFETGDTVEICVHAEDTPDYCDANELDTCWFFMVDPSGPIAEIIEPLPGTFSACDPQPISITLFDENGINHPSVHLTVNGLDVYGDDATVTWAGDSIDTMVYTPDVPYSDGDTVRVILIEAEDMIGNPLATPLSWRFTIDYSPPYISGASPDMGEIVPDAAPSFEFNIFDDLSGLDVTSIIITINDSAILDIDHPAVSVEDSHIVVNIGLLGWFFESGDRINICVSAWDSPDYCEPNVMDTCWWFEVNPMGPTAEIIEPLPETWSACDDQSVIIGIFDPDGVVDSTVQLEIAGVEVRGDDPTIIWSGDTLIYTPMEPWEDGEIVLARLLYAEDVSGNPLSDTLSWYFYIDLSPPLIWDITPADGEVIALASPVFSFSLHDSLSGLDDGSVELSIGGETYSIGDLGFDGTWIGDSLYVVFNCSDAGIVFSHNDTVEICVNAADNPHYCDPNELVYCWQYLVDIEGPVYSDIFDPLTHEDLAGLVSSCSDQGFCIELRDSEIDHGVDETSILIRVDGTDYTTASPELSYSDDTLCFSPSSDWEHDDAVVIELISAVDSLGNPLLSGGASWSYRIDLEPPYIYGLSPAPGTSVGTLEPTVSFSLTDSPAGTDLDATQIAVDIMPAGAPSWFDLSEIWFTRTDSTYFAEIADIPLFIEGGDVIRICVRAIDSPDFCPPNEGDTCWIFNVPAGGPIATVIEPANGSWSACEDGEILLTVSDFDTVIASTIIFSVNGERFTTGDIELDYRLDTLVFTPDVEWVDGATVTCSLIYAEDRFGNPNSDTLVWSFGIDLSPPVLSGVSPSLPMVGSLCPPISFDLDDALSGLDEDAIEVTVNGAVLLGVYSPDVTWAGGTFSFDLCDVITAVGGDLITICVHAEDMPDYCDPNELDSCWSFSIEAGGPVGTIITPDDGIITSCDPQEIAISIFDSNGVDASTIELTVDGTSYYVGDSEISWAEPLLTFDGGAGFFAHGATVDVELVSADDMLGNPLTMPVSWSFVVDYEPPALISLVPTDGIPVDDISPLITITLADIPAGIDYDGALLDISGVGTFTPADPALDWFGDDLVFDPDIVPHTWSGGDSVYICLDIADLPDTAGYCNANDTVYCWWLLISRGGPIATIIEPFDGSFSACSLQEIIVTIYDTNGVDPATIELIVDGTSYYVGDPEVDWTPPTLTWTPLSDWVSGPVHVELVSATDSLGNELESPLDWWFTMDLETPEFWGETPADGAIIDDPEPDIVVHIADTLSGLDEDCLWMTIDGGTPYLVDDPAVTWDGEVWEFSSVTAGLWFPGGSTVDVCVNACDSPDYCPPNDSTHCWTFSIATGGPIATIIEPLDGTVSACSIQSIVVTIEDSNGVDESTIELEIDGIPYDTSDPKLSWSEPTLIFQPDTVWSEGVIAVSLNSADDMLGNELSGAPVEWSFTVDLTPPDYSNMIPADGSQSLDWQQLISIDIADAILGVDVDSLEFEIDSVYRAGGPIVLRASDAGVSWTDPTFELDPSSVDESAFGIVYPSPEDTLGTGIYFPEFTTITITARAFDQMPDYCDPNGSEFVWSFEILDDDILGPEIFEFGPAYESTQNDVYLEARIADPSGVSLAELIWDDDGELDVDFNGPVTMDSVPMTHDPSDNSWIWRTTASVGNFNSPRTITYRITATDADYDFLNPSDRSTAFADSICPILGGPVATYITPEPGEITACDNQPIVISLTDPDGVDPAPMVLRIDGELVPWGDPRLTYDPTAGELTFQPEDAWWSDMQTITVFLTLAEDSLGNPMWDTLSYSFQADLQAPAYSNEMPPAWTMIRNAEAIISVDISDNLAGVRADELAMRIDGIRYDLSDGGLSWDGAMLSFAPAIEGVEFIAGDTVCITVYAGDDPDLCEPNRSEFDWCFLMEPKITCNLFPNPFTPNGDGINDFAVFDYPEMFSGDAELLIFDIRNKLIYKSTIGPVSEMGEFGLRQWRGTDNDRKSVNPGIYLYIIQKDGEVVCNGTIVLSR